MNNKDSSKICIMIVPHTEKVKKLMIPKWLPKAIISLALTLCAILLLYINRVSTYQTSLKQESSDKASVINELETDINQLETNNKSKDQELADLKSQAEILKLKTTEVEDKLVEIDKLQKRLEQMAGIKSPSRGGGISRDIHPNDLNPTEGMNVLIEVLEDKQIELTSFIDDLDSQFKYLDSLPNLTPTSGRHTSGFGNRRNPFGNGIRFHQGIDIANSAGTDIKASAKGVVTFAGYKGGYGKTIIIDHGYGYKTLYAHNSQLLVNVGDNVSKAQSISKMGSTGRSTGSHLHFEIHKTNQPINPFTMIKR